MRGTSRAIVGADNLNVRQNKSRYLTLPKQMNSFRVVLALMALMIGPSVRALDTASVEIRSTIEAISAALETGEMSTLQHLTTNSFRIVEDGVEYDIGTAVSSIKVALKTGAVERSTHSFSIQTEGSIAWVIYQVDGVLKSTRESFPFHRIETAVLVRKNDGWKVALLTSTPQAEDSQSANK